MNSENPNPEKPPLSKRLLLFCVGAASGSFLLIIPLSFYPVTWNPLHIVVAASLITSCGILAAIWGMSFVESLMKAMESSGY